MYADGSGLTSLPGTRREVESIRGTFDRADRGWTTTCLLGTEANEGRLHRAAPRARFLHLATHHIADETDGASRSRLALAGPADGGESGGGDLRLGDLLEDWRGRLTGCEIVVLSACETQRGALQRDEGVVALPWGFQFAGVPSVIASLWRVDDRSTAELMSDFYVRLLDPDRDATKLEALTAARRALREKRAHPYHWAPFVYLGDPR